MEPVTVVVIGTLMMLLNGGVLGLMHRDLPEPMRPSAANWRIATLLLAGGCVLLSAQKALPAGLILPLSNGLLMVGLTGYWRALRLFYGQPVTWHLGIPAGVGVVGIFVFAQFSPNLTARVIIACLVWVIVLGASVATLIRAGKDDVAISRRVLAVIFATVAVLMALRGFYFAFGSPSVQTVIDSNSWVNLLTPMVACVLPVVGTTAYLLLCSERLRRQWEQAASTDHLTGLSNRRTLTDAGAQRLKNARDRKAGLAVALVDVDHFKAINDRHGHAVGDLALQHVAARLKAGCRSGDLPARQGGEEFVVVLEGVDSVHARAAGERLRTSIQDAPFIAGDLRLDITVSIGVATFEGDGAQLDDLLRLADQALYRAKTAGRNRVEMATAASETLQRSVG